MENRIRLLLMDFDGTLADTREAHYLAYARTLREAGIVLDRTEYDTRFFGMRCAEFLAALGIGDEAERERIRRRKIELYPEYFDLVRLNRPLWDFAQSFRAAGGRARRRRDRGIVLTAQGPFGAPFLRPGPVTFVTNAVTFFRDFPCHNGKFPQLCQLKTPPKSKILDKQPEMRYTTPSFQKSYKSYNLLHILYWERKIW